MLTMIARAGRRVAGAIAFLAPVLVGGIVGVGCAASEKSTFDAGSNGGDGSSGQGVTGTGDSGGSRPEGGKLGGTGPVSQCGNGVIDPGETCDDGVPAATKLKPGWVDDGCSALCQLEDNWVCPTAGKPCKYLGICGNGILTSNKQCDDGNTVSGDGCSSTCKLEPGYACPLPGSPCEPVCGDGIVTSPEQCDNGNTVSGDGCSSTCRLEAGWACTGSVAAGDYVCKKTVCGNGIVEGLEACDLGTVKNDNTGTGCSPTCTLTPICPVSGGQCTGKCGDGIVEPGEQCDDGNTTNADGCSSTCMVEAGFTCSQPPLGNTMDVPVVWRDFNDQQAVNGFPDFNPGETVGSANSSNAATTGLVAKLLDSDGKPVYVGVGGGQANAGWITSATTYAQWFRDDPSGQGKVNRTVTGSITLYANGSGGYVNRWGPAGQQWTTSAYSGLTWCSNSSNDCTACPSPLPAGTQCFGVCPTWGSAETCYGSVTTTAYDGTPVFFPVDPVNYVAAGPNQTASGATLMDPVSPYQVATIAPAYGGNWNDEPGGGSHNFNFTSEIRYWFVYYSTMSQTFDFTGDDDVWVFLNRQLIVDLGGVHSPTSGSFTLDAATASTYGLTSGDLYEIAVFQDERQTTSSTFKMTLSGFNISSSVCIPVCGNGIVTPPEQCDNGTANDTGGYGKCNANCTRGPFCGDGIVQTPPEQCDLGAAKNTASYGEKGGCTYACLLAPYCGDGVVDSSDGEQCDLGAKNGMPDALCSSTCQLIDNAK